MTLINCTPHVIVIKTLSGDLRSIAPSGIVPRVESKTVQIDLVDGGDVALFATTFGEVQDLPCPMPGVLYIVSGLLKAACPDRSDLVTPAQQQRDEGGRVTHCLGVSM